MDEQVDRTGEGGDLTRLQRLETSMAKEQMWDQADRAWLITELRKAWSRLAESEAWIPVDPSRIG